MTPWRRIAPALAVFLVVAGVYLDSKVTASFDSKWALHEALSLARRGDLDLEEYRPLVPAGDYRVVEVAGPGGDPRLRSYFPPGTAVLAAPWVAVADLASGGELGRRLQARAPQHDDRKLEKTIASLLMALAAALFYLLARTGGPLASPDRARREETPVAGMPPARAARAEVEAAVEPRAGGRGGRPADPLRPVAHRPVLVALLAAGALAFATPAWSLASRALWQHGPVMLLLTATLLLLTWGERRPEWVAASALPLAFAFVVRPTAALALLAFGAAVAVRHPRRLPLWLALAAAVLAPFVLWSRAAFGTWLPPYYGAGRLTLHADFAEALLANLVSPARGLLIYAPVVLLAPVGFALRRGRWTAVELAAAGAALLWWPLVSAFPHWWAGHTYGPRFLVETIPLHLFLALPAFAAAFRAPSGLPDRPVRRRALAGLLALTLAWGLYVNARGARSWEPWSWDAGPVDVDLQPSRVWDWGDPPFLR
ncbi:MAG TPA: hypothetical protein VHQ65_14700 [Thermoanaerobaculia bacterium]|nr:hypothetical protein [Thermoanaerobaculia bacterium]